MGRYKPVPSACAIRDGAQPSHHVCAQLCYRSSFLFGFGRARFGQTLQFVAVETACAAQLHRAKLATGHEIADGARADAKDGRSLVRRGQQSFERLHWCQFVVSFLPHVGDDSGCSGDGRRRSEHPSTLINWKKS